LYRVRTYAEEFYTGLALAEPQQSMSLAVLPGIAAGAALVSAASAVVLAVAPSLRVPARIARPMPLGGSRIWITVIVGLLLLLIAGVPLGNLMYKAGMRLTHVEGQRVLAWSPWQFARIAGLSPWKFRAEIGWTIVIGGLASTAALAVAAPLAWWTRRGGWRTLPAVSLVALGTVVPGPLIGLSVIWLLDRQSPALCMWLYDRSVFAPVLAIFVRILPVAVLMCWYTLRSVSDDVLDSAACEGASHWTQFWLIAVPMRWAGLGAAWLAGFAIASGDLACSILVIPPGVTTVSVRVFGLIHAGVDDQVAGLCLTVVVGVAALTAALAVVLRSAGMGGQTP
jgi:iron(III) transport system permease protein